MCRYSIGGPHGLCLWLRWWWWWLGRTWKLRVTTSVATINRSGRLLRHSMYNIRCYVFSDVINERLHGRPERQWRDNNLWTSLQAEARHCQWWRGFTDGSITAPCDCWSHGKKNTINGQRVCRIGIRFVSVSVSKHAALLYYNFNSFHNSKCYLFRCDVSTAGSCFHQTDYCAMKNLLKYY